MNPADYLSDDAQLCIREAIAEAGGNEVFFVGRTNHTGLVESVETLARGNRTEVPAIIANCRPGDVVIHNHPSSVLAPSNADTRIASHVGNEGIGFYIVDNEATAIYVVVEPVCPEEASLVDAVQLRDMLVENGPLSALLEEYEVREPQIEMLDLVARAFNEELHALIEAGTGTGKSIAYLLPAISWSLANRRRVVVSTNTINLQQQLTEKDVPVLKKLFKQPFRAVLVKGRSNYVCLRKLNEAVQQPNLLDLDEAENELLDLQKWANKTKDGSKSDLGTQPSAKTWEAVQSESDTTLKKKCPYYHKCFFYNARRQATTADVLIANHHLLFADLAVRAAGADASEIAVLPKYERVILDEAHNLEDVASRYFGVNVSYLGTLRVLNRFHRNKRGGSVGHLPLLRGRLEQNAGKIAKTIAEDLETDVAACKEAVEKARSRWTEFADRLFYWLVNKSNGAHQESKLRLTDEVREDAAWQEMARLVPGLVRNLNQVGEAADKIVAGLSRIQTSFEAQARSLSVDLKAQADRLTRISADLTRVLLDDDDDSIRWLEARSGRAGHILRFCTAPIDVAPIMKESVFDRYDTVVMTSATLSVGQSFAYMRGRIGLDKVDTDRVVDRILPSPFDYSRQAVLAIPTDIPEPNAREFRSRLPEFLYDGISASGGRAFALFTSYSLLNQMHAELEHKLALDGIAVYKQGAMNRHRLLDQFRTDRASVLFGTDSFWEGVDVRGDALVNVIMPRLPFRVPSEPVIEARMEAIERAGGNAFFDFTVPQAVLKFKQGFGRLIRSRKDFGAILILDRRVVSKSYGRLFLASLPECTVLTGPSEMVMPGVRRFLEEGGSGKVPS